MDDDRDGRLERIWRAVAQIPPGAIDSYGGVARRAGLPGRARLVGRALALAPEALGLPWHRVLDARGRIALPPGSRAHRLQRQLLAREGVRFVRGRAVPAVAAERDLDALLWRPR